MPLCTVLKPVTSASVVSCAENIIQLLFSINSAHCSHPHGSTPTKKGSHTIDKARSPILSCSYRLSDDTEES